MFVALLVLPGGVAHARSVSVVHATWRWPLRGPVVGRFRLTPRAPYARGQRRGIDVAGPPGSEVRAACPGRVIFTGALPRLGLAVSVRCGALVATYLRLARVDVHRGVRVGLGERVGTLGPAGVLRLGARRAADRRGYVDPLTLLRDPEPAPPALGPAPRPRALRPPRAARARPLPGRPRAAGPRRAPTPARPRLAPAPARAEPRRLPWPAYPALALVATALPVGGLVRRRRRARATVPAAPHAAWAERPSAL
jgi:Peptidase family M23